MDGTLKTDGAMRQAASKMPEVTLGFSVIKVIATTLGETGGHAPLRPRHHGPPRPRTRLVRMAAPSGAAMRTAPGRGEGLETSMRIPKQEQRMR